MHDVCVIGAGWAGLTAASRLQAAGLDVLVVEKARGPGGRCSTRRQDGFSFDHGAQYFTARSPEFSAAVESWKSMGLVAPWQPRVKVFGPRPADAGTSPAERLVGVPAMNAVLKHLASDLTCRFGWRVGQLIRYEDHWQIRCDNAHDMLSARTVLLTAPPQQSAELLTDCSELASTIAKVPMNPCWALMLAYEGVLDADFDAAFDNEGPLSWLARNGSKPGRRGETWLLHASPDWSLEHLEREADWVAEQLLAAFHARVPQAAAQAPVLVNAHRCRYALAPEPLQQDCLTDSVRRLVVAGDWCAGNRIEGAWTGGMAAAEAILTQAR